MTLQERLQIKLLTGARPDVESREQSHILSSVSWDQMHKDDFVRQTSGPPGCLHPKVRCPSPLLETAAQRLLKGPRAGAGTGQRKSKHCKVKYLSRNQVFPLLSK